MKKLLYIAVLAISTHAFAQSSDWGAMSSEQRREAIQKLSPEQRKELLRNVREKMLLQNLDIPHDNQAEFRDLYSQYQESQESIKKSFNPNRDFDHMSDAEARQELEKSFTLGQKLLDNRRNYAEKFQKVIKPQKVLQIFQNEGKFRNDGRSQDQKDSPGFRIRRP